jgi:serine protease Do
VQDAFGNVAARVFPSVVGVTGYVKDATYSPQQKRDAGGPLWTAAGVDALRYPGYRPVRFGSGFVVDEAGFVLSRDQLLRDETGELASLVDVELADHSHRVASIVGTEPTLDLAVLQVVEPSDGTSKLPAPVQLGDSDRVAIGQWVLALGDPPGNEQTFAVGIVAAPPVRQCYQQELSATRVQSSLVIPDRALGGPVVDIQGRVIGLGVGEPRGAAPPANSLAVGHVLPINLVLNLYEALKIAHSTRSPWIGISVLELDRMLKRAATEKPNAALPVHGIGIDDVFVPSPAASAGVKPGDFLVELGGHAIQSVGDFQKWMYVLGIGAKVELGLVRDGQPLRVTVTIEARPPEATTS